MILPYELLGFRGINRTKEFREQNRKSLIIQKVEFEIVSKLTIRIAEVWNEFCEWLSQQQINTIIDFDENITTTYEISEDLTYVKYNAIEVEYFVASKMK